MSQLEIAKEIVVKLRESGYLAYFAGGWVRDYLLGIPCDDVDIATDATAEEVAALFPNSQEVGASFGVTLVRYKNFHFEVAMFRKDGAYENGRKPESVEPTDPKEDAQRRDFTINGLFYDPVKEEVLDYVSGEEDLKKGIIRAIGNPKQRFFEDRLRMVRAVRFAARFGFSIEKETAEGIRAYAHELFPAVAVERIWPEFRKMTAYPGFGQVVKYFYDLALFEVLFPEGKDVDIEKAAASCDKLERGFPTILFFAVMLSELSAQSYAQLCERYKLSTKDSRLLQLFARGRDLSHQEKVDPAAWVSFYAEESSDLCIRALATCRHENFLPEHRKNQEALAPHIERKRSKRPLVSSSTLISLGVRPGPQMGSLLKEAEEIAANEDLHDGETVLGVLRERHGGQF